LAFLLHKQVASSETEERRVALNLSTKIIIARLWLSPDNLSQMWKQLTFLLSCLTCVLVLAQSNPIQIKNGFGTGNDYRQYTKAERLSYSMGFVNGLLMAPAFDAPKQQTKWLEEYVVGMKSEQVATIISKFLDDNPGRWHEALNVLSFAATKDAYDKAHPSVGSN
jgi:hypothetical protein